MPHRTALPFALPLALWAALAAVPLAAQPDRGALREAEGEAGAARTALGAAAREAREAEARERALSARRAELGRRAVAAEEALAAAEERLDAAERARDAAEAEAKRRAEAIAPLIPAMRRLNLWPAETLLAVPAPPEEALRGALVLRGLARRLAEEAAEYRRLRAEADRTARAAGEERARLTTARAAARDASAAVEAALAEARERRQETRDAEAEATRRAAAAAAGARDLRAAVERLEREATAREARERAEADRRARERAEAEARRDAEARREASRRPDPDPPRPARPEFSRPEPSRPEPSRPEPSRPAEIASAPVIPGPIHRGAPVAGVIQREFGTGGSTGQSWSAAPGARVVSPCSGRIVFAGPFRSYGRMLIVDCGGGYHFVLAGLDRLDGEPGQRVGAGEAVGTVGGGRDGEGGRGALYVELRRAGQAVDPRGWAARG
ncbi:murein hydrolase activator EnvC family protein [Roseomonas sp. CCTCC AB2023176]|uniref:murein hydrolase activator EnvC family protein n=1 Tax=Roseomonas sp. CCTCC AB2023176 TaxID=3342640 RepID=UPI0035E39A49